MSDKKTGGPAYPLFAATGYAGMTLRDYFAAKALWGVLNENHMTQKQMAEWSYEVADQMLKAREA